MIVSYLYFIRILEVSCTVPVPVGLNMEMVVMAVICYFYIIVEYLFGCILLVSVSSYSMAITQSFP